MGEERGSMEWEMIIVKFEVRLFHEPSPKQTLETFIFKLNRTTAFEEAAEKVIFLNY